MARIEMTNDYVDIKEPVADIWATMRAVGEARGTNDIWLKCTTPDGAPILLNMSEMIAVRESA